MVRGKGKGKGDGKCYNCGEPGDIAMGCPKPRTQANTSRMGWGEFATKFAGRGAS